MKNKQWGSFKFFILMNVIGLCTYWIPYAVVYFNPDILGTGFDAMIGKFMVCGMFVCWLGLVVCWCLMFVVASIATKKPTEAGKKPVIVV